MAGTVITCGQSVPNNCGATRAGSQWLIDMTSASTNNLKKLGEQRSRIRRVPDVLRKNRKHAEMFDPAVVAIGPYHRGKHHLLAMEDHKKAAAEAFARTNMDAFYNKVVELVGKCRECYDDDDLLPRTSDEEFALMLFFDACFILHFIDWFVKNGPNDFTVGAHLHGFILRDMFLLENQLPYLLLEELMKMKEVPIDEFLDKVADKQSQRQQAKRKENSNISMEGPYPHLLARLRERQLGPKDETSQLVWWTGSSWPSFRSAKELIDRGIMLQPGRTNLLRNISFRPCLVLGKLSLPLIVIDDLTRSRLLNMIALEMCSSTDGDYGITSFVWLLDMLIDHADDVKELRRAGVLLNALGSDEQVAELFNDIATDLAPDQQAYQNVLNAINSYYGNKIRISIYRMLHTHFSSPWTVISFLAALFVIALTVVQTIYTVRPAKN